MYFNFFFFLPLIVYEFFMNSIPVKKIYLQCLLTVLFKIINLVNYK